MATPSTQSVFPAPTTAWRQSVTIAPGVEARHGAFSMVEAVQLAVARHPAVAEAVGRIREQDQMIVEARSGYLPKVGGGMRSGVANASNNQLRPTLNLSASQMIYDFGKVASRVDSETAEKNVRHAQLIATLDELARETSGAVVEINRYNDLIAIAKEHIADNEHILKLVTSRADKGASTRSDRLQAEARVQAAQATLFDAQSQVRRWQSTLAALTGLRTPIAVNGAVPEMLRSACSRGAPDWSKVSSVMRADAEIQGAGAQLQLSKAEIFPTVSVESSADAGMGRPVADTDYSIGLKVSASLYDGGSLAARGKAAAFAAASAEAARARAMLETSRSLNEAAQQIDGLQQQQALLESREQTMKATRDLYEIQYRDLGTRTLLDLLNAADEFHGARFQRVNIAHNTTKLKIECAFSSGSQRQTFSIAEPDPL